MKRAKATANSPDEARRINLILKRLNQDYPDVVCALNHSSAWELLAATILSAQCTDVRVNMVTPTLFAKYPGPADFALDDVGHDVVVVGGAGVGAEDAAEVDARKREDAHRTAPARGRASPSMKVKSDDSLPDAVRAV